MIKLVVQKELVSEQGRNVVSESMPLLADL